MIGNNKDIIIREIREDGVTIVTNLENEIDNLTFILNSNLESNEDRINFIESYNNFMGYIYQTKEGERICVYNQAQISENSN